MNTPVTLEIAMLLKEKGFKHVTKLAYQDTRLVRDCRYNKPKNWNVESHVTCSAPTIIKVIMWLYNEHGIWIAVDWMTRTKPHNSGFYGHLRGTSKRLNQDNFIVINDTLAPGYEVFNSPTEAYIAAIEYVLKNLI